MHVACCAVQSNDFDGQEVMVDEEGEDEWCWEEEFELTDDALILPPIEQVGSGWTCQKPQPRPRPSPYLRPL